MKKLIIINGPAGIGKSTVAKLIHKQVKPSYLLSCDSIRRFLNDYHELPREGRTLRNKVVLSMLEPLLSEHITVVLEQLHTDSVMLNKYRSIASKHHADVYEYFLWIDSEEELLERFRARQKGPTKHPNSSLTEKRISGYWHKMKELVDKREVMTTLNTTQLSPQDVAEQIITESQLKLL